MRVDDIRYIICNRLDEIGAHLYMKCKKIKECWRFLGLESSEKQNG